MQYSVKINGNDFIIGSITIVFVLATDETGLYDFAFVRVVPIFIVKGSTIVYNFVKALNEHDVAIQGSTRDFAHGIRIFVSKTDPT